MAAHIKWCHICQTPGTVQPLEELEELLPPGYTHLLCVKEDEFRAHLKVQLSTKEAVEKWLEEFQNSSTLTWRKARTYPESARYNVYRVDLRCQHKTYSSGKTSRNTNCPATLFLVLKRSMEDRRSRSTDRHMAEGYLLYVNWRNEHNHGLAGADALRKRDVSAITIERLTELFERGHSPSSALETIKYDLQEEEGDEYVYAAADRAICPDLQFCYRLYHKIFQKSYSAPSGEKMAVDLRERLARYNEEHGCVCAQIEQTIDGQQVVAICTPVMQRVHTRVQQSGEMIFVESLGNCNRKPHRLFLFLTPSAAGGLPLGVLITTSESAATLTAGISLLKRLLPPAAFFGRGDHGPQAFMTDDCSALRQALAAVYPGASLMLSTFHLLQAMWRWLWNSHNGIKKEERPQLLNGFRGLVYARTAEELSAAYATLSADPLASKHNFMKRLLEVYGRRQEWALCLRGNTTNNYVESAVRIVRDKVLHRLKAYNLTQLVDFITTRFEASYIRRLTDFANNRVIHLSAPKGDDVDCHKIVREDEVTFLVPSASTGGWYHINTGLSCCTCPVGRTGAPCRHQGAVEQTFGERETLPLTSTPPLRKLFYEIASGRAAPDDWFVPLEPKSVLDQPRSGEEDAVHTSAASSTESLERELDGIFGILKKKLLENTTFEAPLQSFVDNLKKMKSDSAVQSALFSFGKTSCVPTRIRATPTTTEIGVQPTAVSLGGRRALGADRPPKSSRRDHPYTKGGRAKAEPHSLSHCVQGNTSLGKTH
ncbi:uncharacterized protein LOC116059903 isoform X2 [Sander lucioperca]|uniref:uncharacterized protein LOC116059903 isoform X2 n=1 Tax=Sander lucioperca TaxID=283035 RepID=UPI00125E175F|nr:uncharacterized protein LOC116059903 isoform X2 [Sander lucioperca]